MKIRSVKRAEQVVVETDRGDFTFDALVLTSPLDEALSFLDATAEEAALAAKIKYNDYRVVIASASGLPEHRYVLLPKHVDPSTRGEVLFWHKRWHDRDVYTFYAYGREGSSLDETTARVGETVRRLGGTLKGVHYAKKWRYFPHVSTEDLADGFFERMEGMQGARHTYYAGSCSLCYRGDSREPGLRPGQSSLRRLSRGLTRSFTRPDPTCVGLIRAAR